MSGRVSEFGLEVLGGEEESVLEAYGREVIPALREVRAAAIV